MVDNCYRPTSAGTNRMVAFAKNLGERDIHVSFFFLFPSDSREKCQEVYKNVDFIYLWDKARIHNKYLTTILSFIKFRKMMVPSIPIYVYSMINLLYFFRQRHDIRLYSEITECPEFSGKEGGVLGSFLYRLFVKTVPKLDGLFVITPSLKNYFVDEYKIEKDKVHVVNMTVDPDRFNGVQFGKPQNVISYCGIMGDKKDGISNLIRSFALFHKQHPLYKLCLMGGFEDDNARDKIPNLIKELGLSDYVLLKGLVPHNEIPQMLTDSKILVLARPLPKEKAYGFATKIGEYLMTQRPVVMTNVARVEDYLSNLYDVILATPESVEDFADKLCWVVDNYDKAEKIGKQGRITAMKVFNASIETEKIIKAIYS